MRDVLTRLLRDAFDIGECWAVVDKPMYTAVICRDNSTTAGPYTELHVEEKHVGLGNPPEKYRVSVSIMKKSGKVVQAAASVSTCSTQYTAPALSSLKKLLQLVR